MKPKGKKNHVYFIMNYKMGKEKKKNPYLLLSADKRIKHSLVLRSLHQICLWTRKIILGFLSEKKKNPWKIHENSSGSNKYKSQPSLSGQISTIKRDKWKFATNQRIKPGARLCIDKLFLPLEIGQLFYWSFAKFVWWHYISSSSPK